MTEPRRETGIALETVKTTDICRVGCVSYINSKPLIEGLDEFEGLEIDYKVPAELLEGLESDCVDIALCPVVDYFRSGEDLVIVPSSGIGCAGETYTVRLFSKVAIEEISEVYADADSHTSVALMRVILAKQYGVRPRLVKYKASERTVEGKPLASEPEAMLLIGDKVVTDCPNGEVYNHQLDLGEAWWKLTGLPFVYATWLAKRGTYLGSLPEILSQTQERNCEDAGAIADKYAEKHGWPRDLAVKYFTEYLRYTIGIDELAGIKQFAELAAEVGVIDEAKKLVIYAGKKQ